MSRRAPREPLFGLNVWPPMVDAMTLVLATFVLLVIAAAATERGLVQRLRERDRELEKIREDKARIERRLQALAMNGAIEVEGERVIMQGEVLFDSGSDELLTSGRAFLEKLAQPLASLLAAEAGQMVMIGGHTDDLPIHNARFASNWDLSTARAVAVAHVLTHAGLAPEQVVAAGFGPYHPRAANADAVARRRNRRIEILLVPIRAVASP